MLFFVMCVCCIDKTVIISFLVQHQLKLPSI